MHGQVKVRRSPEQEAQFREKRNQANQRFAAMSAEVLSKRRAGNFSLEILVKIAELLEKSPDTYTLWNYRRDILSDPTNANMPLDPRVKLFDDELSLTARCLLKNPKSYPTWHYRTWVMEHHPRPDWGAELGLCGLALKSDERNFHCWDYRRFVTNSAKTPSGEELKFITSTLEDNFSNYSAWHYRSGLIGADDEVCTAATPVSPPPSLEFTANLDDPELPYDELDLVHNAIFTDPKDQGPWYYYWWLLGRGIKRSYLREVYLSRRLQRAVLVFSRTKVNEAIRHLKVDVVVSDPVTEVVTTYSVEDLEGWKKALPGDASAVWWFDLPKEIIEGCTVSVTVHNEETRGQTLAHTPTVDDSKTWLYCQMEPDQHESLTRVALDPRRLLNFLISPVHEPASLQSELDTVRELVSMEPNNKYALLTLVSLLRYIRPPNCGSEIEDTLKTLRVIDSHRNRQYADWASAHAIEDALVSSFGVNSRAVNVSGAGLTCISCLDWCSLMTELNFSNNQVDKIPETFAYLVCLKDLNLDDNQISSLKPISGLPQLKRLSICRNRIATFEGLEPALSCLNLRDLDITGNKVAELPDFTRLMAEHPGSKRSQNSLNVVYNKPVQT